MNGNTCGAIKQNKSEHQHIIVLVFYFVLFSISKSYLLQKTSLKLDMSFLSYDLLKDCQNNRKQKYLFPLFGSISKSIFVSSDSFCLITSHILWAVINVKLQCAIIYCRQCLIIRLTTSPPKHHYITTTDGILITELSYIEENTWDTTRECLGLATKSLHQTRDIWHKPSICNFIIISCPLPSIYNNTQLSNNQFNLFLINQ